MARFIAKYAKYRHGVRAGRFMVLEDGQRQELTKELFARFDKAEANDDERQLGIVSFNHTGLPEDRDTNEHISPRTRISAFDSVKAQEQNGWTDEEREIVEAVLRNSPAIGDEFIEVIAPEVAKPWGTYDSTPAEKVVELALAIGVPLSAVASYESQNGNREEVLTAIEAHLSEDEGPEVVIQA